MSKKAFLDTLDDIRKWLMSTDGVEFKEYLVNNLDIINYNRRTDRYSTNPNQPRIVKATILDYLVEPRLQKRHPNLGKKFGIKVIKINEEKGIMVVELKGEKFWIYNIQKGSCSVANIQPMDWAYNSSGFTENL